jgi:hypothetical protein
LKEVDYKDEDGRLWRVRVPADCPVDMYALGIPIGPPSLDRWVEEHGWSKDFATRLHNELHARRLYTRRDVLARPRDVQGALTAALRCDMQTLQLAFLTEQGG